MARGRSGNGPAAAATGLPPLPPLPPALRMPSDRDRIATTGRWEDWLSASRPAIEVVRRLNDGWRLPPEVRTGVYSNGREQGIRFTRPAAGKDPGLTVWLAEYRSSDHIAIYRFGGESDQMNWAELPEADALYEAKRMLGYDEGGPACELIVEWFAARPLSDFAPAPARPRRLVEALSRPRSGS